MTREIVSHAEVLACVLAEFNGAALAADVSNALAVSVSTARRKCEDLTARGWLARSRSSLGVDYTTTERGREAHSNGEAF